ncbi:hypothetical protein GY45DRAFT_1322400 [Cubamyces sp. BRFM 1775]|nr:hypothetical protein GY45DRAFT_1322400 [Cubamyces sp. BRFM 1775]
MIRCFSDYRSYNRGMECLRELSSRPARFFSDGKEGVLAAGVPPRAPIDTPNSNSAEYTNNSHVVHMTAVAG